MTVLLKLKMPLSHDYENALRKLVRQTKCFAFSQNIMPSSFDQKFVEPFKNTKISSSTTSRLISRDYTIVSNCNTGIQKLMLWLNLEICPLFQEQLFGL